jgi:hypothetical protein
MAPDLRRQRRGPDLPPPLSGRELCRYHSAFRVLGIWRQPHLEAPVTVDPIPTGLKLRPALACGSLRR